MATTFDTLLDGVSTTLGSQHVSGSSTLVVAAGAGAQFGTSFPLKVTVTATSNLDAAGRIVDYSLTTRYKASGRTGDTLTGCTVVGGMDHTYDAGSPIGLFPMAADFSDIHTAVNVAEADIVAAQADIAAVQSTASGQASAITALQAADVTLSSRITTTESMLAGLGTAATHAATDFATAVHTHALSAIGGIATNRLLGRSTSGSGIAEEITVGTNLTLVGGVLSAAGGAGGGGGGYVTIQDEGTDLTARTKLNFAGASVAATDDVANSRTVVTVSALVPANNLSDLASSSAARANLQLGSAALASTSDFAATVHAHSAADLTSGTLPVARMPALSGAVTTPAGSTVTSLGAGVITDANVAVANKDGAAATPSLRTLGTGAAQACAGNDARLSDARTPTAHAISHKHGGSDEVATATAAANAIPKADATGKLGIGWLPDLSGVYQPLRANLTAIGGLTSAADTMAYFIGSGQAAVANFTAAGRALIAGADAATQRTTLGLGSAALSNSTDFATAGHTHGVSGITGLATGVLVGRSSAGTGAGEAITIGTGLTLASGTLSATGGGGSSGAGTGNPFVTFGGSAELTNERVLAVDPAVGLTLTNVGTDGGALTIGLSQDLRATASPAFASIHTTADATIDGAIKTTRWQRRGMTKTLGANPGDTVQFAEYFVGSSGASFVRISASTNAANISGVKAWYVPLRFNATGGQNWQTVRPFSTSGDYFGQGFELDVQASTSVYFLFRLRRTGTAGVPASVDIVFDCEGFLGTFGEQNIAATGVVAPTDDYRYSAPPITLFGSVPSGDPGFAAFGYCKSNGRFYAHSGGGQWVADSSPQVYDIRDFGAKVDGSTNDTTAVIAAMTAASTVKGVVYFPAGVTSVTALSLSGQSCSFLGDGDASIIRARSGQSGPVVDFTGYLSPANFLAERAFANFRVEGDGTAGSAKKGIYLNHQTSLVLDHVSVGSTGGACLDMTNSEFCRVDVILQVPVGANANDVPCFYASGAMNGNRLFVGMRGMVALNDTTTADLGVSGAFRWESSATDSPNQNAQVAGWCENLRIPTNGCIAQVRSNMNVFETFQLFDCRPVDGSTNTAVYRFLPGTGSDGDYGGNLLYGIIPGGGTSNGTFTWGVDCQQKNNRFTGIKGYNGKNVRLASGVTGCTIDLGGAVSTATTAAVVDSSGNATNVVLDAFNQTISGLDWQGKVIGPAYLGTGTRDGSKFLRDDGTYQTVTVAESQVTNLVTDLAAKAPLASPALTGTPTAPTAAGGTNTTQVATTAFVLSSISGATLAESQVTNLVTDLAAKAPLASPALTGTPTAPTATGGTNNTQIATTAFVASSISAATIAESQVTNLVTDLAAKAPLASPALTGIPSAPTASAGTNTTQVATTAFVLANSRPASGNIVLANSETVGWADAKVVRSGTAEVTIQDGSGNPAALAVGAASLVYPLGFTIAGTPTVGLKKVCRPALPYDMVLKHMGVIMNTAPSGGPLTFTVRRSSDGGTTFPDTVVTATIPSGTAAAEITSFTTASLSAHNILCLDIGANNGAADIMIVFTALSKNQ